MISTSWVYIGVQQIGIWNDNKTKKRRHTIWYMAQHFFIPTMHWFEWNDITTLYDSWFNLCIHHKHLPSLYITCVCVKMSNDCPKTRELDDSQYYYSSWCSRNRFRYTFLWRQVCLLIFIIFHDIRLLSFGSTES